MFKPAEAGAADYLFLDFNSYFASVEQHLAPMLRGKPVVVTPAQTEHTCAIAASYEAKAHGVRTGTMIHEARRRCPGLIVVPARHDIYVDFHHRLLREVDRHAPIHKVHSIDELACRLTGRERAPENAIALARRIKRGIAGNVGESLRCSIGLGGNSFLAKVASDMQKPDGLTFLDPGGLPGRLLDLNPVDLPGIGRRMEPRLHAQGVFTMADLWALDRARMRALWRSVTGVRFWYALHGYDMPEQATERRSIGHSHVLAPERRTPTAARLVMRRLLAKACARARRMKLKAGVLGLYVRFSSRRQWKGDARHHPTQDSFAWLAAADGLWARMARHALADGEVIKVVSVSLFELTPEAEDGIAPNLFVHAGLDMDPRGRQREKLCRSIDRLNQRYGRETVSLGVTADFGTPYTGTKIAFTRIPDLAEFHE